MKLKIFFFPIALFVAFMITIFFTKPEWDIYQGKQEELDILTKQLDDLKSGHTSILNATKKLDTLTSDQESLVLNAMPKSDDNDDLLAEIHKSAERSGVFIISTKVKSSALSGNKSAAAMAAALAESSKPILNEANIKVTVMGSYLDVLEFVKEVDSHNRLTVPKELVITAQDVNTLNPTETETEFAVSGAFIKGEITFDFYNKAENEKLQIASLIRSNDPVIKSLLLGQFKSGVIEKYNENITSEVFRPVGAGNTGKIDIFSN